MTQTTAALPDLDQADFSSENEHPLLDHQAVDHLIEDIAARTVLTAYFEENNSDAPAASARTLTSVV